MGAGRVKIVDMCPNTLTIDKKTKEVVQIMSRESKFSECGFFLKLQRRPKKKKRKWVTLCSVIPTLLVERYFGFKN